MDDRRLGRAGSDAERLVRSIRMKDSPELLARLRPRLVREVHDLEGQFAAATTDAEKAKVEAFLVDARYYLEVFDHIVRARGVTLPGDGP